MDAHAYLMTRLRFVQLFTAILVSLVLSACSVRHIDPPLFTYDNPILVAQSAQARAKDIGGLVFFVLNTHSMEPLISGGDLITVDTRVPVEQVKVGQPITYRADWLPADAPPVTHRVIAEDKDGFIVAGDNVRPDIDPKTGRDYHSENRWRVTKANYIGVVDGIYRFQRAR